MIKPRSRKVFGWLFGILAAIFLIGLLLNLYVKERVKSQISQLEQPVAYEDLDVNVLLNKFKLREVSTRQDAVALKAKEIKVMGLSYYKFLFKDKIEIEKVSLENPEIRLYPQDSSSANGTQKRQFKIGSLLMKNGNFSHMDSDTSEVDLYVRFPEVELKNISRESNLPLENYRAHLDSVFLKMDGQHAFQTGKVKAENGQVNIENFSIVPFDSKEDFVRKIQYEKDRISLEVAHISMENFSVENTNDTILLQDSKMVISDAFLKIYRNKLIPEDPSKVHLYNEVLRNAPVKVRVDQILVENSEIIYEEQVKEERREAVIRFTDVTAEINNLHNLRTKEISQPKVSASARFMRGTPVSFDWTFPVFDPNNSFDISGRFGHLEGEALDPFLVPSMDMQLRGAINSVNFNFSGNEQVLSGPFTMDYDHLEVEVMGDEGEDKKSFFSAVANLFVENESNEGAEDEGIQVERDKKRSFWNFIWRGLREGLLETAGQL